MNFAEKSIFVKGNTKNGKLSYVCYPINEFSNHKWLIAINAVIFDSSKTLSSTLKISCNFVTGQQRFHSGDIKNLEQPLNSFHIKTSTSASRGIFRFGYIVDTIKIL